MPKDVKGVIEEFETGQLHSGSKKGPVVKKRSQAIAIGLSEQRQLNSGRITREHAAKAIKKKH